MPPRIDTRQLCLICLGCLLVLPWLNPVASGPAPAVYPWLMAMMCASIVLLFRSALDGYLIALTWQIAAAVSAVIGLLQYFGLAHAFGVWVHPTELGDAFANLRQRNQFATLTSIGLVALHWWVMKTNRVDQPSAAQRLVYWLWLLFLLFTLALGNAASSSRTGMLQWCIIFLLAWLWKPTLTSRQFVVVGVALATYFLAVLTLPTLLERGTGATSGGLLARFAEEPGCASRRVLWSNVMYLIAQKPWMGWGWGELDYAHFVTLYPGERFCDILDNAHNLPLHLAVELGLPLAGSLLALLVWWLARNRPWAESDPTRQMAWAVLAVIGLHSLLEYPMWYGPFQLAVGLCVLMLWRTRTRPMAHVEAAEAPSEWSIFVGSRPAMLVVGGVMLAALSAAAWDYWRVSQLYLQPADRAAAYRDNTLEKVRSSWFFQDQVQFAELTTRVPTKDNASQHYAQAVQLLHFSPEPRVIEAVIESAVLLGQDQEALYYLQRYKAAFPEAQAAWAAQSARYKTP